jgi:hypothetical protein
VKSSTTRFILVLILLALPLAGACKRGETAANATSETIAPAAPQPATSGTDAMTQTVDIEDSRSEAEGGALTETTTATVPMTATATTTTTTTTVTTKKPAKPPAKTATH